MALKDRVSGYTDRRSGSTDRGLGSADITVKGRRATARQRSVIDGCLEQTAEDGGSRRLMVAVVMTITQESNAGELAGVMTGNDDVGIFQQGRNWVSEEGSKDPHRSTHAFLVTGPTSWKKVHGGLKKVPGDLESAIKRVQISVGGYAQWEREAERTVDAWLENGGSETTGGGVKRYLFTRGEKGGQRENSWDAAKRLVDEVGAYRWAAGNVLFAVSGDELRAQAPSLTINGDEGWLMRQPAWSWSSNRAIGEVTLQVLADRWDVMPGGVVMLHRRYRAMSGKWMVWNVSGSRLDSPEVTVVLRRPTALRKEPAPERREVSTSATMTVEGGAQASGLRAICQHISDNRHTYVYGGSHGPPLSSLRASSPFDCSSSCSYALHKAGMFEGRVAIVSGTFATSWGRSGKGREFTVWANPTHVWIEGYDESGDFAWRFDTSQHSGKSGPALTTVPRNDQGRFTARHWPGR